MAHPRPIAVVLLSVVIAVSGCTTARSSSADSADPADGPASGESRGVPGAPLPTIGLGSELDFGSFIDDDIAVADSAEVDTVVMIGDSITVASTPALEAQFAALGFESPVIVSAEGKRMAEGSGDNPSGAAIADFLTNGDDGLGDESANELWIVALATNDIGQYDDDEIAAAVNEVLANVPPDAPLVWVDTFFRGQPDGENKVNSIIADRVGRRGNAVVAPWSFFAGGDGVLRSDGVHPSSSGTEVFAAVVAETAARFLGR